NWNALRRNAHRGGDSPCPTSRAESTRWRRPPDAAGSGAVTRSGASLVRLGLTESWAEETLTQLGWWAGDRPADGAEQIMWALARSPDPALALRGAERLVAALTDRRGFDAALRAEVGLRGRLLALLGSSTVLGDHLALHPDRWHRLRADHSATPAG